MIAYLDSSVILRRVLGQPGSLREWSRIRQAVVSALVEVECLQTLDRLRLSGGSSDDFLSRWRDTIFRTLAETDVVELTSPVLHRAAQPFPTTLGTLDAIHLATALLWREERDADVRFATHDATLATAARAMGVPVIGV